MSYICNGWIMRKMKTFLWGEIKDEAETSKESSSRSKSLNYD